MPRGKLAALDGALDDEAPHAVVIRLDAAHDEVHVGVPALDLEHLQEAAAERRTRAGRRAPQELHEIVVRGARRRQIRHGREFDDRGDDEVELGGPPSVDGGLVDAGLRGDVFDSQRFVAGKADLLDGGPEDFRHDARAAPADTNAFGSAGSGGGDGSHRQRIVSPSRSPRESGHLLNYGNDGLPKQGLAPILGRQRQHPVAPGALHDIRCPRRPRREAGRRNQAEGCQGRVAGLILPILALVGGHRRPRPWYVTHHGRENTDDAQVDGEVVAIPARLSATVTKVHFIDNQPVKAGDLLVELDDAPAKAKLAEAEASLAAAIASSEAMDAEIPVSEANAVGNNGRRGGGAPQRLRSA